VTPRAINTSATVMNNPHQYIHFKRGIGLRREVADQKYRPDDAEDERHRLNDDVPLERGHQRSA